jgi:hypothetical protein
VDEGQSGAGSPHSKEKRQLFGVRWPGRPGSALAPVQFRATFNWSAPNDRHYSLAIAIGNRNSAIGNDLCLIETIE